MHTDLTSQFGTVRNYANYGQNQRFLEECEQIYTLNSKNIAVLEYLGSLYLAYGFPSQAKECYLQILSIRQNDLNAYIHLGHAELLLGNVNECRAIYKDLLTSYPSSLKVLQNIIFFNEYDPDATNDEFISLARKWGNLAIESANGPHIRPQINWIQSKKIKLGYVSGDICQHTVGLLIKNIIANHNKDQFEIYVYSSGSTNDWVTNEIKLHSIFLDIQNLDDQAFVQQIRTNQIDILVDLSGHTGGSRLSVFAHRPAPIQLSWLGYYATTGLEYIDGVMLDRWHASPGIKKQFIEPVIELPPGRWCYTPAFPAPSPAPPPFLKNGFITFGSFNNTLKYNRQIFRLWSEVLRSIPNSRLILKWRTFNDNKYQQFVFDQFAMHGVDRSRIELRGPSFHLKMLEEYQDIDIALDPFPFSGGITSCEALYMGVPVITWPQERVVSRQTFSFLSNIGLPELIAGSEKLYIEKAVLLAHDQEKLSFYRNTIRGKMIHSPLMQIKSFTQSIEATFHRLITQYLRS